ncbi:SHOCT domain-containing protein [Lacinutrix undariae]
MYKIKWLLLVVGILFCMIGFMVKLPVPFRKMDQELHALFYFFAAAFINVFFGDKKLVTHLAIFGMLLFFSVLIEFVQQYSNIFFNKRIHGRFDPQDLKYNIFGLVGFSFFWMFYYLIGISNPNTKDIGSVGVLPEIEKIEQLKTLFNSGGITRLEFENKKYELLKRI